MTTQHDNYSHERNAHALHGDRADQARLTDSVHIRRGRSIPIVALTATSLVQNIRALKGPGSPRGCLSTWPKSLCTAAGWRLEG